MLLYIYLFIWLLIESTYASISWSLRVIDCRSAGRSVVSSAVIVMDLYRRRPARIVNQISILTDLVYIIYIIIQVKICKYVRLPKNWWPLLYLFNNVCMSVFVLLNCINFIELVAVPDYLE